MSTHSRQVWLSDIAPPPDGRVRNLYERLLLEPMSHPRWEYRIVEGDGLYRRAIDTGSIKTPATVRDLEPDPEDRLRMHHYSYQLTPIEQAQALEELRPRVGGQRRLAILLGTTQPQISRKLSLLRLPPEMQQAVHEGWMSQESAMEQARRKYRCGGIGRRAAWLG